VQSALANRGAGGMELLPLSRQTSGSAAAHQSREVPRRVTRRAQPDQLSVMELSVMGFCSTFRACQAVHNQEFDAQRHDPEQMVLNSDPQGRDIHSLPQAGLP